MPATRNRTGDEGRVHYHRVRVAPEETIGVLVVMNRCTNLLPSLPWVGRILLGISPIFS